MEKKKKKKAACSVKNEEKRIIDLAFNQTIKMAKRISENKRAAKIYDLAGPILKRRKAAVLRTMPAFQKRYEEQYPELDLKEAFADECCGLGHSVDGIEKLYHFTLAAALWMLDMLRQRCRLYEAEKYLRLDAEENALLSLPDFCEANYSREQILAMVDLISNRDERDNPYQWYINDESAKRESEEPYDRSALQEKAPEELRGRERFSLVMEMIPPECKKRAVERFEKAFWEFQDALMEQYNLHASESAIYSERSESLFEECEQLREEIEKERGPFDPMQAQESHAGPFALKNMETFSPKFADASVFAEDSRLAGGMEELKRKILRGIELEDLQSEAELLAKKLLRFGPGLPMGFVGLDEEDYPEEDLARLLSVEIEDPYEICFGYLCLMESGSDLPWLYQPANAVLLMAARKLPWTAFVGDAEMMEWLEDWEDEEDAIEEDEEEEAQEEEPEESMEPAPLVTGETIDWTAQKAELYRLRYSGEVLYDPEELPVQRYDINLPQLVYGLTSLIMPRNLNVFDSMHELLEKYGMEEHTAKSMELYLQLAFDCRQPCQQAKEAPRKEECPEEAQSSREVWEKKLLDAENRNKELEAALYQAEKRAEEEAERAEALQLQAEEEKRELADLRELVYAQANEQGEELFTPKEREICFPYENKQRIAIFGGHETWLKAIRPMLPSVTFAPREQSPNPNLIRSQDVIWIQANSMAHKDFYKLISVVRTNHIPVHYFGFASARKCALQLVEEDQKRP